MKSKNSISDMEYMQSYKYKLYPTEIEKYYLDRCIDLYRYAYNWAVNKEYEQYEKYIVDETDYKLLSEFDLIRLFTEYRNLEENSFLKDVPTAMMTSAFRHVVESFKNYYSGKKGAPKFKSKKNAPKYFGLRGDRTYFSGSKVKIQGINPIDLHFDTGMTLKSNPKMYNGCITKDNFGNYFISFSYIESKKDISIISSNIQKSEVIGIDLNHDRRYVLSNGHIIYGIDTEKEKNAIKKWSRRVSKDRQIRKQLAEKSNLPLDDIQKSNRAIKREHNLQKAYKKLTNKTKTFIQVSTKEIIKMNPKAIVMENLSAKDRNHFSNQIVYHDQFALCRTYMQYACEKYNIPFILADKNFPSSQICSNCGNIKKMNLGLKTYICPICGARIDRDLNAAINLSRLASDYN